MSAKTKIVVLHMKELIYTAIFVVLVLLLAMLLFFMFHKEKKTDTAKRYEPGLYTADLPFQNAALEIEVAVDREKICDIQVRGIDESLQAMYPLVGPSVQEMKEQIIKQQSTEKVQYETENQYTCQMILKAIDTALEKAKVKK